MPSRVHYVFGGNLGPRFDQSARQVLQDLVLRKAGDALLPSAEDALRRRIGQLPPNFRKAIPILEEMAKGLGCPAVKKLRKFRLPKHLRRSKNPIFSWKSL